MRIYTENFMSILGQCSVYILVENSQHYLLSCWVSNWIRSICPKTFLFYF